MSFGQIKFPLVFAAVVLAGLAVFMAFEISAPAQVEPPLRLTGDDIIQYDLSDRIPIIDPELSINRGQRVGDGCRFTDRLERAFGAPPQISRTLAVNFTTCEKLVETGSLTQADLRIVVGEDALEPLTGPGGWQWGIDFRRRLDPVNRIARESVHAAFSHRQFQGHLGGSDSSSSELGRH